MIPNKYSLLDRWKRSLVYKWIGLLDQREIRSLYRGRLIAKTLVIDGFQVMFIVKSSKRCPEWHDVILATDKDKGSWHVEFDGNNVISRNAQSNGKKVK